MQLEISTSIHLPTRDTLSDNIRNALKIRFDKQGIPEDNQPFGLFTRIASSIMTGSEEDSAWVFLREPKNAPIKRVLVAIFGSFHVGNKEIYPSYFSFDEWVIYFRKAGKDTPRRITEILH